MTARTEAMAQYVRAERAREPTVKYATLVDRVRERFAPCSRATAERAITNGTELLRNDFAQFCADAPRAIFDAYMSLHAEHIARATSSTRERDRVMHLANARRNLDSVRDMFGMRSAINININSGDSLPLEAFAPLSDIQLEALAALDDIANDRNVLDVPSVEASVEMAGVALDVIEHEHDNDDTEER